MRVGVLGYGNLGQYIVQFLLEDGKKHGLCLDFVWNRNLDKLKTIEDKLILRNISDVTSRNVDLIIEVSHPNVIQEHGVFLLSVGNLLIGSPTALADIDVERKLRDACHKYERSVFVPSGALWGAQDIQKMATLNTLCELKITMKKHPSAFKVLGELKQKNEEVLKNSSEVPVVLYDGPIRELCSLAPNNVNTMAAAAIAAHNLGFDNVTGCLVSDMSLSQWHVIEIVVRGKPTSNGLVFETTTVRNNPAAFGRVTGSATYASFCNSLLIARHQQGPGFHMC